MGPDGLTKLSLSNLNISGREALLSLGHGQRALPEERDEEPGSVHIRHEVPTDALAPVAPVHSLRSLRGPHRSGGKQWPRRSTSKESKARRTPSWSRLACIQDQADAHPGPGSESP